MSDSGVCLWCQGPVSDSIEKVCLRASELISCEWCSLRKLPVLFFQTTPEECVRLQTQLDMSKEKGDHWYDCTGDREYKIPININMTTLQLTGQKNRDQLL